MADASPSESEMEAIQVALRSRLVESGEYDKLLHVLKSRLEASGWEDQLRGVAREKARVQDPPSLDALVRDIQPSAIETIPAPVRAEIEALMRTFVEENVE